jgi:tripartite-type tricarboxylate transporter receptor subunit TctC
MTELTRRSLVATTLVSPFAAYAKAYAQTSWPSGTIRIVVPFPAGGTVDTISRLAQTGLQQRLGVNVIVENRPGASGSTGSGAVAKSPPDGMTWLMVNDTHAVNPFLLPRMPFDTADVGSAAEHMAEMSFLIAPRSNFDGAPPGRIGIDDTGSFEGIDDP